MASGDTKTEHFLDVLANGSRADIPTDNCCNTKTQNYILEAVDRMISLEEEVEELQNNPDVTDIVSTYQDLTNYDKTTLTDGDVIRVLTDSTHDDESAYYRYNAATDSFDYIGTTRAYTDFVGTSGGMAGAAGLVPAPQATDADKFLKSDGTWATASGSGGGTEDYNELENLPSVNSVTLSGNKTSSDLGVQNALVSGTNIKTINNKSILGSGDMTINSDLSDDVKNAILDCFENVAWATDQGKTYYDALYDALYGSKTLVSISAVFNQGQVIIYEDTSLDDLKQYLTVTALYDDSSTATVTNYSLSGPLTVGTSTITVTYEGETDTFTVVVTATPTLSSIDAVYTQSGDVYTTDTLDSLKSDLVVTATYADSSTRVVTDYILSGTLTAGTSTITVTYEGKIDTFDVLVEAGRIPSEYQEVEYVQYDHGTGGTIAAEGDIDTNFAPTKTSKMVVTVSSTNPTAPPNNLFGIRDGSIGADNAFRITSFSSAGEIGFMRWGYSNQGISYDTNFHTYVLGEDVATIDGTSYSMTSPKDQASTKNIHIFGEWGGVTWIASAPQKMKDIELYSDSTTKVKHYVPCYRKSDGMIGFYDLVGQEFVFNSVQTYTTKGADV